MSDEPAEFTDEKVASFRRAIEQCVQMLKEFPFEAWRLINRQKCLDEDAAQAFKIMKGGAEAMRSCADDLEASIKTLRETTEILTALTKATGHFNYEWAKIKKIAESPEFKTMKEIAEMQKSGFLERLCKLTNEIPGSERSA